MKSEPERSCIVTREVKAKEALIRFVVSPQGVLVPDLAFKLPGRGIYVSVCKLLVAEAIAKRLFSRAAKTQVQIPEGFINTLEMLLRKRVVHALSMARKSGQVISGFDKVEQAVQTGKVEALVFAAEADGDGVKKLSHYKGPIIHFLPGDEMSEVLGREHAVYAAVIHGPMAAFFIEEARRFALFLGQTGL